MIYNLLARDVQQLPKTEKKVLRDQFLQFLKDAYDSLKIYYPSIDEEFKPLLKPYYDDSFRILKFIVDQFDYGTFFQLEAKNNPILEDN